MNLRLKPFEQRIRPRVRRELRNSPAQAWKEYRRVRKRREYHIPPWLFRFFVLFALSVSWSARHKSTDTLVAMTLLWAVASVAWRAGQLLITLRASPSLLVLAHVPIPDEEVFKFQWQMFLRRSLWSVLDFTALYGMLAERAGYGWNSWWMGLFMALVQWLVVVSLAAGLLIYVRKRKFFRFAGLFAVLAGAMALGIDFPSLTQFPAAFAYWVPPTGWILSAMGISPERSFLSGWWPVLAMSAALFALPLFYRRLRSRYVMPEGVPGVETVRGAVEAQRRSMSDGVTPDAYADIKAAIRTREFMQGFNWRRGGWVERLTARWLTPEERVAAEFLSGGDPNWTRELMKSSLLWAGLAVLLFLVPRLFSVGAFIPIFMVFSAKKILFKGWPGTTLRNVSGSHVAMCSVYPLGFWQIARVSLKVNLAILAVLMPFLLLIGDFALQAMRSRPVDVIQPIWKILVVILALQLFSPIRSLTVGTNDGSRFRMILLTILAAIILGAACLTMFLAGGPLAIAAAAALLGGSIGALWVYGHAYNHNWFDLQNKPKTAPATQSQ